MAIQIPTVQRMEPQATPSVGRVDVNLPDAAQATAPQRNAFNQLAQTGFEVYTKRQREVADTVSSNAHNDFLMQANELLYGPEGVSHRKGDPTKAYEEFDSQISALYDNINSKYADYNGDVKESVKAKLQTAYRQVYDNRTKTYGKQFNDHADNVTETSIKLLQNKLNTDGQMIDPNDEKSMGAFHATISAMADERYKQASRQGYDLQTDEQGNFVYNNAQINAQIGEDSSSAVKEMILTLTSAGDYQKAEALMKDNTLNNMLTPGDMKQVTKAVRDSKIENEGIVLGQMAAKMGTSDSAFSFIEKNASNPLVMEQARKTYNSIEAGKAQRHDRDQKVLFRNVYKEVIGKMTSGEPYADVEAMRQDPSVKAKIDRLEDGEQIKKILKLVSAPDVSDHKVYAKAVEMKASGQLVGISDDTFLDITAGLSARDRAQVANWVKAANASGMAGGQIQKQIKSAQTDLITRRYFPSTKEKYWSEGDRARKLKFNDEYSDAFVDAKAQGLIKTEQDVTKFRNNFIFNFMKDNPKSSGVFGGGTILPTDAERGRFKDIKVLGRSSTTSAPSVQVTTNRKSQITSAPSAETENLYSTIPMMSLKKLRGAGFTTKEQQIEEYFKNPDKYN